MLYIFKSYVIAAVNIVFDAKKKQQKHIKMVWEKIPFMLAINMYVVVLSSVFLCVCVSSFPFRHIALHLIPSLKSQRIEAQCNYYHCIIIIVWMTHVSLHCNN